MPKRKPFKCKSEAQKKAIRANYARMAKEAKKETQLQENEIPKEGIVKEDGFPEKFPFWQG